MPPRDPLTPPPHSSGPFALGWKAQQDGKTAGDNPWNRHHAGGAWAYKQWGAGHRAARKSNKPST